MTRWSTAYLKAEVLYFTSDVGSNSGSSKLSGPFFSIEYSQSPEAVGTVALEALAHSRKNVQLDPDWRSRVKPLIKMAKAKSWRDFLRGTKSVHIREVSPGIYSFYPLENDGKEGFDFLPEFLVVADEDGARVIGEGLMRALSESR